MDRMRLVMLDTTREYALRKLIDPTAVVGQGGQPATGPRAGMEARSRHVAHVTRLATGVPRFHISGPALQCGPYAVPSVDDLLLAVEHQCEHRQPEMAVRACLAAWQVVSRRGGYDALRVAVGRTLRLEATPPGMRFQLLRIATGCALPRGLIAAARTTVRESFQLADQLESVSARALARSDAAVVALAAGSDVEAQLYAAEALRHATCPTVESWCQLRAAEVGVVTRRDPEPALQAAQVLFGSLQDRSGRGRAATLAARHALANGNGAGALEHVQFAIREHGEQVHLRGEGEARVQLGVILHHLAAPGAVAEAERGLTMLTDVGDVVGVTEAAAALCRIHLEAEDPGAATAVLSGLGVDEAALPGPALALLNVTKASVLRARSTGSGARSLLAKAQVLLRECPSRMLSLEVAAALCDGLER